MLHKIIKTPIYDLVKQTNLSKAPILSQLYNNNIYFKREDEQIIKSFKIRGAYQKISSLTNNQLNKGLITASAGNHAQGVGLSAKHIGCQSTIIMPKVTPQIKINSVKQLGTDVILEGNNFDEAYNYAIKLSKKKDYTFIHPFDDLDVIAGQGTIGMEICNQWKFKQNKLDAIFIPVGGGGLISGIGYYLKTLYPDVKIIGVEPIRANALYKSLNFNKLIELDHVDTFADGVAVKKVGFNNFNYCKKYVDEMILCSTDDICESIQLIFEETRVIMEPAGALSLAGIINYIKKNNVKNMNYVSILTGANINFTRLRFVAERSTKNEILLAVKIKEEPGSLKKFCTLLDSPNITEFNYRYSNSEYAYIYVGILTDNKNDIINKLINYDILDISDNELAKTHLRYQVGGKINQSINEEVYRFEFPEVQGALINFLTHLSDISNDNYNITMFHYRNTGSSIANVMCGINTNNDQTFQDFLTKLNYNYYNETNNKALRLFC